MNLHDRLADCKVIETLKDQGFDNLSHHMDYYIEGFYLPGSAYDCILSEDWLKLRHFLIDEYSIHIIIQDELLQDNQPIGKYIKKYWGTLETEEEMAKTFTGFHLIGHIDRINGNGSMPYFFSHRSIINDSFNQRFLNAKELFDMIIHATAKLTNIIFRNLYGDR